MTSTGSGLSVPDWPLSFGQLFPPMVGGVRFEHAHRLIAGAVSILTFVLAVAIWLKETDRLIRFLASCAVAAVLAQALLGGMTVLLRLPPAVSIAHACLGQIFFSLLVCLAVLTAPFEPVKAALGTEPSVQKLRRLGLMTTIFIYLQLTVGAILRHTAAVWAFHLHLLMAVFVAVHVILLGRRVFKHYAALTELERPARALMALLGIQLVLGFYAWRVGLVVVTTAHVAVGALLLATSGLLTLQSYRRLELQ